MKFYKKLTIFVKNLLTKIKLCVILQLTINVKYYTLTKGDVFMETKMDRKINTFAKIGRILSTIAAVFMIIGAIAVTAGIGITASMPDDALAVEVTGTADVTAKGKVLESIGNAIIDSSEGGDGKIYLGDEGTSNVAVGDVKDSVPEGVTAQKTDKGFTRKSSSYSSRFYAR